MKLKTIRLTIEGHTPLLMNRFHEEAQEKTNGGTSMVMSGDRGTPREQATPKVYSNHKGDPCIPGPNLFSCIVEAGKYHKAGKKQITTGRSSLIPAGISVNEIDVPVLGADGKAAAWEVDSRPIVNPATKGRRLTHRPRFDVWSVAFSLDVDVGYFDPKLVRAIIDDAGARVGLGDFRPDRKGPFGKFKVTSWEVADV